MRRIDQLGGAAHKARHARHLRALGGRGAAQPVKSDARPWRASGERRDGTEGRTSFESRPPFGWLSGSKRATLHAHIVLSVRTDLPSRAAGLARQGSPGEAPPLGGGIFVQLGAAILARERGRSIHQHSPPRVHEVAARIPRQGSTGRRTLSSPAERSPLPAFFCLRATPGSAKELAPGGGARCEPSDAAGRMVFVLRTRSAYAENFPRPGDASLRREGRSPRFWLLGLLSLVAGIPIGCAGEPRQPPQAETEAPAPSAEHRARDHRRQPRPTERRPATRPTGCPVASRALDGVYHPERLKVLDSCRTAKGRVASVRHEEDGDLHVDVELLPRFRGLLSPGNRDDQHGDLVVELMARDGGHLPAPSVGDAISLVGAWVNDTQHGWNELHPVWSIALNGGRVSHSGPQFGGTPAADRSENAEEDCRTNGGRRCQGYGPTPSREASLSPRVRRHSGSSAESSSGGGCAAGYSPCLPAAGDLDCGDISTSKKPVRVTGRDPYGLDRDGDGVGCDSG